MNIYDAYRADLQTQQEFTLEVKRWKTRWVLYPRPCKTKPSLRDIGTRQKKKIISASHPLQQQPKDLLAF